ncbi:FtsQ family cell division protein [Tetragenococcus muriaticus PMC-11-5]|uniref:Cell division protein DivIB n=2 Tax=Tetragenococcus muriaticus TaxID=64642 RepID=A0A091C469_9ENTE|nr:FtsQ family cell division protein [Tetragenococcus muriaticus PMC-11-5]
MEAEKKKRQVNQQILRKFLKKTKKEILRKIIMTKNKERTSLLRFTDRLPKLKRHHKQLHKRLFILITLFTIPLLVTLYYISPLNSLSKVEVEGNQNIDSQEIIASSDLQVGQKLWSQYLDREEFTRKIVQELPRVKNAEIKFSALNQFKIDVTEHEEVSLLAEDEKYYPILENGEVVRQPEERADENKVILENFNSQNQIMSTIENYYNLPDEIQSDVSQINYTPSRNNEELLTIFMNDGNRVIVNISNMEQQMQYYPQVAQEMDDNGIVDMEVGIFVRPYDENSTEDEQDENEAE